MICLVLLHPYGFFLTIHQTSIEAQAVPSPVRRLIEFHDSRFSDKFKKHLRSWRSICLTLTVGRLRAVQGLTVVWFGNVGAGRRWRTRRAWWTRWAWQTRLPGESWWTSRAWGEGRTENVTVLTDRSDTMATSDDLKVPFVAANVRKRLSAVIIN